MCLLINETASWAGMTRARAKTAKFIPPDHISLQTRWMEKMLRSEFRSYFSFSSHVKQWLYGSNQIQFKLLGKVIYNLKSLIYKWPLADPPSPSLTLSLAELHNRSSSLLFKEEDQPAVGKKKNNTKKKTENNIGTWVIKRFAGH